MAAHHSSGLAPSGNEPFLAVAAATASVLVTGNVRHFPMPTRRGMAVFTPR